MVCILVLVFAAGVFAGQMQTERSLSEGKRFIGTVVATDRAAKTIVARNWRGEAVFDTATARFAGHGSLEDVELGERVLIRYVEEGGKKIVRSNSTSPVYATPVPVSSSTSKL